MFQFILWYVTITLIGLLSFPLVYRLFPGLADRGYSLSRAFGLITWGFIFWLSVSLGLIRNEIGGLLFALVVLLSLSLWATWKRDSDDGDPGFHLIELKSWVKNNSRLVFTIETLFLLSFIAWAFVRANNPETTGTEKPMEIAFINAILHSPTFPPHDPWLGGYGISYYYFGYILAAMLAMFTNTSGGVTFNLMLSLVFALSIIGSYGLLLNLLRVQFAQTGTGDTDSYPVFGALLAPIFVTIIGNVEGFLELLHAFGLGWGNTLSNFWTWLNMKDLSVAPSIPYGWEPRFWFWWRASRILHDYDLLGNFNEVIDEFPFFSYLLGDLHPHVLAMPFGLLAAAMALNLYQGGWRGETGIFGFKIPVQKSGLAALAVVLGGLAFLNTWDFPVYLAVVSGAFILALVNEHGWNWDLVESFLKFSIPLAVVSVVLYLPFYISFSSQAGGILPNVIFPTRGAYIWIMFGTLLVPLVLFLLHLSGRRAADWKSGFLLVVGLTVFLWLFSIALGLVASQTEIGQVFITSQGQTSTAEVLSAATLRRLQYSGGLLTLVVLGGTALSYLLKMADGRGDVDAGSQIGYGSLPFMLMFIVFGALLVLAPEFIYLRDQFGSRMNTVFKFYYQAWLLWSLAAAFGVAVLLRELRGIKHGLFSAAVALVLVVGLAYPVLALPNKTDNFNVSNPERRTLDGAAHLKLYNPDDYAAIMWLSEAQPGLVAEAVGGSYTDFGRVATYSGQPTVLGWPGHEGQWRGGYNEVGSRGDDIARLYTTSDWIEADMILQRYGIRYVYIGVLERNTYSVDERKFAAHLSEIYRQGQVVIYEVP